MNLMNKHSTKEQTEYVSCPFNPIHRMLKSSLQRHIIHCMKNYPEYVPCFYDEMHWFSSKEEMMAHAADCPSKQKVIGPLPPAIPLNRQIPHDDKFEGKKFHCSEENWDEEYL